MITDLTILNIISFLLIFFIGLPHGSFDGAVASLVGLIIENNFFTISYLLHFFIFMMRNSFWLYFPIVALFFIMMTIATLDYVIGQTLV